jgi:signal transduction histidine kinase
MTNMKKHSKATAVIVTFQKEAAKLLIQYKDNGIGCKLSKHNGLHNTENRINSVNGTITFESEPNQGFKATMSV